MDSLDPSHEPAWRENHQKNYHDAGSDQLDGFHHDDDHDYDDCSVFNAQNLFTKKNTENHYTIDALA